MFFILLILSNTFMKQYHDLLRTTEWTNFLAMLGSGVLTFLAGAEIDPASLRANFAREHEYWGAFVPAAVPLGVAIRAVGVGLAFAPSLNCRNRTVHDFGCGGLCGDDRRRAG